MLLGNEISSQIKLIQAELCCIHAGISNGQNCVTIIVGVSGVDKGARSRTVGGRDPVVIRRISQVFFSNQNAGSTVKEIAGQASQSIHFSDVHFPLRVQVRQRTSSGVKEIRADLLQHVGNISGGVFRNMKNCAHGDNRRASGDFDAVQTIKAGGKGIVSCINAPNGVPATIKLHRVRGFWDTGCGVENAGGDPVHVVKSSLPIGTIGLNFPFNPAIQIITPAIS